MYRADVVALTYPRISVFSDPEKKSLHFSGRSFSFLRFPNLKISDPVQCPFPVTVAGLFLRRVRSFLAAQKA
jgi:hypothetical protein